jgi:hypothetical protein
VEEKWAVLAELRSKQPETAKFEQLDLSNEWKELIKKLWERDDLSISDPLGEIVGAVKSSKSNAMAERALHLVFYSPKVQRLPVGLLEPANIPPERQAVTAMVDAARLSRGSVDVISAALRVATKTHGGLELSKIMRALDASNHAMRKNQCKFSPITKLRRALESSDARLNGLFLSVKVLPPLRFRSVGAAFLTAI